MKSGTWTLEEEDLLREYVFKYKRIKDIARALERSEQSVAMKIRNMRDKGYLVW